jgi:hypothetical protein
MYQKYEGVYQRHRNKGEFNSIREICISTSPFMFTNLCINIISMRKLISKFANANGEPTELTMRIGHGVVGFIIACSILIIYTLLTTQQDYHFGIYG